MVYLTPDEVVFIHDREAPLAALQSPGLLESAVYEPQQTFDGEQLYPTIHLKAAALLRGIACNHAFMDGNKRTALLACHAFYALNGWLLVAADVDMVHLILDTVLDHWSVEKIADRLEQFSQEISNP